MGVGHGMSLFGLKPRDQGPPTGNPDTRLPKGSQGQGSGGRRYSEDWLQLWEGCSQDSWALLGGNGAQDVSLLYF